MLHGQDGKKLSKRHGATAVGDYETMGILPAAMRNFLALLGWNPGDDRELFFAMDELVAAFAIDRIQKTSAVFDMTKLEWMNGQYLSHMPLSALGTLIAPLLRARGLDPEAVAPERLERSMDAIRGRCRTTLELAERVAVRVDRAHVPTDDDNARAAVAKDPDAHRSALEAVRERLGALPADAWEPDRLEQELRDLATGLGVGAGKVMQPVRIALTGQTVSEPVNVLLWAVGRDESLARLAGGAGADPARRSGLPPG
jgi:glutamyl-tRNA synthetase